MRNPLNTVLRTGSRVNTRDPLQELSNSATRNVISYGADPTGVAVSSAAIQAAANAIPATGGVLYIPPGVYRSNTPVFLKSNTKIVGPGATLLASAAWVRPSSVTYPVFWSTGYWFFTNVNINSMVIIDENIEIHGVTFDYRPLISAPGGGRHAFTMRRVRNVKVVGVTSYGGDDLAAFLGCDDTLCDGCSAYDFTNAAYDHWAGSKNARVIGCYAKSSLTVQMVNFNAVGDGGVAQVFDGGLIQGCMFDHPDASSYSSVFLDPLGAPGAHTTKNIIICDNIFRNVIIVGRGDVQNVLIQGNQFIGTPGKPGIAPISFYTDGVDMPDGITIDSNTFIEPQTAFPFVGVIDLRTTNPRITNNRITGAGYSVPGCFMNLSSRGIEFGNVVSSGSMSVPGSVASGSRIKAPVDEGVAFEDSTGSYVRAYVSAADQFVFRTTDSGGGLRDVYAIGTKSATEPFVFKVEMRTDSGHLRTMVTGLTAAGSTQAGALSLTAQFNNVTTVAASTGVRLYNRQTGELIVRVRNGGANALSVYPFNAADQIDDLGAGNPYSLAVGKVGAWCLTAAGQWYTVSISP